MIILTFLKEKLNKLPLAVNLYLWLRHISSFIRFRKEFDLFKALNQCGKPRFKMAWEDRYPCLSDKTATTDFDRHYVYHLAWAARKLAAIDPKRHIDISSSIYFCSMISAFFPFQYYDCRPVRLTLSNLTSETADLTNLPFENGSVSSLSCMHVVEHIGLGRYGDPLNPDGDLQAISELKRVLAVGGSLLFVVPIGRPKIMFNAHRIYSYAQIIGYFSELQLREFALIPDNFHHTGLILNADPKMADLQTYGCGCFWFTKGKDLS